MTTETFKKPSAFMRLFNGTFNKLNAELFEVIAQHDRYSTVKLAQRMKDLVQRGADINAREAGSGATPLNLLCLRQMNGAIEDALALGADIWCANGTVGSALESAAKVLNTEALTILTEHCRKNPPASDAIFTRAIAAIPSRTPWMQPEDATDLIEKSGIAGASLFNVALARAKKHLQQPDDFYKTGEDAMISQHIMLAAAYDTRDVAVMKSLLAKGMDPDACGVYMPGPQTALARAVMHDDIAMVKVLLAAKADPNLAPYNEESPTRIAAQYGRQEAFALLFAAGGDTYGHDRDGKRVKPNGCTLVELATSSRHPGFAPAIEKALKDRARRQLEEELKTMTMRKPVHIRKAPVNFKKTL